MTVDISPLIASVLRRLRTRIDNMIARSVARVVNDNAGVQLVQLDVLDGETREGCERVQQYGFTSVPLDGAEAVVAFVGGYRDHGLVIACDDRRYRLRGLGRGEVALYTNEGTKIHLKRGGEVEIVAATRVRVDVPLLEVTGSIQAGGSIQDSSGTMSSMRSTYNSHTHVEHGDGGGVTDPPVGEMTTGGGGGLFRFAAAAPASDPLTSLPDDASPYLGQAVCVRAGPGAPTLAYLGVITSSGGAGWMPLGQSE